MSLTETPVREAPPRSASFERTDWRSWGQRYPFVSATVVCVLLAALSAAVFPTVPSYDPWAWISWGREVVDPHLGFTISGGPSWKPLPVMFTTIYALFGSAAAPTLWVITARAGGLLALPAAYRLAARLVGSPGWARIVAGLIAAAGVVVTQSWFYEMFRGTSEPMLIACALWAIDRHLEGRYGWAFVLGVATSQIRPEAWPLLVVYAAWLWWRSPRLRLLVVAGLFSIPFFWFVPPWVGSGSPFLAAIHAEKYNGQLGSHPLFTVLGRGLDVQTIPLLVLAAVAVVFAWFRQPRDRLTLALGFGALVWWVVVVGMTLDGYPGLERFYLPAAGVTCVLAGVGVVRLAQLVSGWVGRVARGSAASSSGAPVFGSASPVSGSGAPGSGSGATASGSGATASGSGATTSGSSAPVSGSSLAPVPGSSASGSGSSASGSGSSSGSSASGSGSSSESSASGSGSSSGSSASGPGSGAPVSRVLAAAAAVAVLAGLLALTIPFTGGRINEARRQERVASQAVTRLDQLSAAVAAVGGHRAVYPCKSSFAAVNHGVQTALAWKLHVTLGRVGTSMRHQGVMFVGPHDTIDGIAARIDPRLTQIQQIAHVGAWRVYRAVTPGSDHRCVGV